MKKTEVHLYRRQIQPNRDFETGDGANFQLATADLPNERDIQLLFAGSRAHLVDEHGMDSTDQETD